MTTTTATVPIAVTGATGKLGRHVVETLLDRGVAPGDIVATGRAVERLRDLADRGVVVRRADYDDPESLREAFTGVRRLLLVSAFDPGDRVRQHTAAIDAAREAGVDLLVYTSASKAGATPLLMAAEHAATEQVLAASGMPTVVLRNGFYVENYTEQLPTYAQYGMATAAGDGRVSLALRREYAAAAAAVLLDTDQDAHAGATYELGGPAATLPEVAAAITQVSGQSFDVNNITVEQLTGVLVSAGLPATAAAVFADVDRGIAEGDLLVPVDDLTRLLGRNPLPLHEAVTEVLGR